jgi:hypothetical protein
MVPIEATGASVGASVAGASVAGASVAGASVAGAGAPQAARTRLKTANSESKLNKRFIFLLLRKYWEILFDILWGYDDNADRAW